ncbi:hypothetical protein AB6A40_009702 [Gnathostoma spinigerum]|uniref:Uncharacterized protein n=1 Tax=Gnathostoma spinigerum TaxID=75299 RepID=A0ABD6F0E6_9BILA
MAEDEIDYDFSDPKGPTPEKAKLGPPDRWMYCPPMATEVIGKHFLAFKTPLCSLYDSQVEKQYQFHPKDVFKKKLAGAEKGAKIGLWVDLTKTNRYYSHKEVERHNCLYKKLPLQGHGATPTVAETKIFCDAVEEYLKCVCIPWYDVNSLIRRGFGDFFACADYSAAL